MTALVWEHYSTTPGQTMEFTHSEEWECCHVWYGWGADGQEWHNQAQGKSDHPVEERSSVAAPWMGGLEKYSYHLHGLEVWECCVA